jgi:hypothetical protein
MALLPLSLSPATGQAGDMSSTASQWTGRLRRLTRRIAAVVADCNDATRLMTEMTTAPDHYVFRPRTMPDTYAEFLYRTSGPLMHEPTARDRAKTGAHP